MCDYSLQSIKTRDAKLSDPLVVSDFGTGTRGFADPNARKTALCVKPGTEIAFDEPIKLDRWSLGPKGNPTTAIFRQVNKHCPHTHHDALELPNGTMVLLTSLRAGQTGRILQMPAAPKTKQEKIDQTRVAFEVAF